MPTRISSVNGVAENVAVQICISSLEQYWIFRRPPSGLCVIVSRPEPHELGIAVIKATCKPKRLEARVSIENHSPEFVVVHPLDNGAIRAVDDETRAAEMIGDDPVSLSV